LHLHSLTFTFAFSSLLHSYTHTVEEEQYHCLTYTQSSLACTITWVLTLTSPWRRGGVLLPVQSRRHDEVIDTRDRDV
jgi:hypothetical protein